MLLAIVAIASSEQGADGIIQEEAVNSFSMAPKALGVFPETTISEESKVPELGFLEMDEDEPVHRHPAKKSQAKQAMAKKVMKLLKAMMEKKEKAKTQKHEARLLELKLHKKQVAEKKKEYLKRKEALKKKKASELKAKRPKVFRLKHGAELLHGLIVNNLQAAAAAEKEESAQQLALDKENKSKLQKKKNKKRDFVTDALTQAVQIVESKEEKERKRQAKAKKAAKMQELTLEREKEDEEAEQEAEQEEDEMRMMGLTDHEELDLSTPAPLGDQAKSLISNLMHVSHETKKAKKVVKVVKKLKKVKKVLKKHKKLKKFKESKEEPVIHGQTLLRVSHGTKKKRVAKKNSDIVEEAYHQAMTLRLKDDDDDSKNSEKKSHGEVRDTFLDEEDNYSQEIEKEVSNEKSHKIEVRKKQDLELQAIANKAKENRVKAVKKAEEVLHPVSKLVVKTRKQLHGDFGSKKANDRAFQKALAAHSGNDADATASEMAASLFKTLGGHALDNPNAVEAVVNKKIAKHFDAKKVAKKVSKKEDAASAMAAKLFKKMGAGALDAKAVKKAVQKKFAAHLIVKKAAHKVVQRKRAQKKVQLVEEAPKAIKLNAKMAKMAHRMAMDLKEASALYSEN